MDVKLLPLVDNMKLTVGKDASVYGQENFDALGYGGAGANAVFPNWGAVLDVDFLGVDWKFGAQFITDDYNAPNTSLSLQQNTILNDQVAWATRVGYEMGGCDSYLLPESMSLKLNASGMISKPVKAVAGGQVNSLTPLVITSAGADAAVTVAGLPGNIGNTSADGGLTQAGSTIQPFNPLQTINGQVQWGYDIGAKLSMGSVDLLGGFAQTANCGSRLLNQGSALLNNKNQMWYAKIQSEMCDKDEECDETEECEDNGGAWYNPLNWSLPTSLPFNFAVDYGSTKNFDASPTNLNVNENNTSIGAEVSMPYEKFDGLFQFRQWNSNNFGSTLKASVQQYGLGGRCHF
jgi:hypothetical protein